MVQINYDRIQVILIVLLFIVTGIAIVIMLPPDDSTIDSDGDGIMNDKDVFPKDKSENADSDNDGIGDNQDMFPFDPSASVDSDNDGYPDNWNEGMDQNDSTSDPQLSLDDLPYDPNEHRDSDGDGYGDNLDVFPNDPSEWSDDDADGIGGNADINPLVDLSFSVTIDKCLFSKNVDLFPRAQVYFIIRYGGETITVDNNENYWKMRKNQETSIGYMFSYDIPDDTDEEYTDIEIVMMDYDFLFDDDMIDISNKINIDYLMIQLDHRSNEIDGTGITEGEQGNLWYTIELADEVPPVQNLINKTYEWPYQNKGYTVFLEIDNDKYQWYKNRDVNRTPQRIGKFAMASFVTTQDIVITQLANELYDLAVLEGFNESEMIDFILRFVQYSVLYSEDIETKGCVEYWRYPVETLIEQTGDCEDSTLLFASIMDNLGYDTVLLFYIIDDDSGHLATGVHIDNLLIEDFIEYNEKKFYYCETTSVGFTIGEKPSEIVNDPEMIIAV